MDPNATLTIFLANLPNQLGFDVHQLIESCCDLNDWINSGGFKPDWTPEQKSAFDFWVAAFEANGWDWRGIFVTGETEMNDVETPEPNQDLVDELYSTIYDAIVSAHVSEGCEFNTKALEAAFTRLRDEHNTGALTDDILTELGG